MNTRRKFLRNSSLATGVMLLCDPFKLLAEATVPGGSVSSLIFLHTNNTTSAEFYKTAAATAALKSGSNNIIVLNAGDCSSSLFPSVNSSNYRLMNEAGYDAVLAGRNDAKNEKEISDSNVPLIASDHQTVFAGQNYAASSRIITKGNIKVGIIGTAAFIRSENTITGVNALAKELKSEKGCNLVICISSLGYKTGGNIDDLHLAKNSVNVDIIISASNKDRIPTSVILNSKGQEVFIDNAGNSTTSIGKIEINFDSAGRKNFIKIGSEQVPGVSLS